MKRTIGLYATKYQQCFIEQKRMKMFMEKKKEREYYY